MKTIAKRLAERVGFEPYTPLILRKLLSRIGAVKAEIAPLGTSITPRRNRYLLLPAAILLTGCNSDRTVPASAFSLALGCFIIAWSGFCFLAHKYLQVRRELARLRSTKGKITRIGTVTPNHETQTLEIEDWEARGGYTGMVYAGYTPAELIEMAQAQEREIERVARLAVEGVGR